MSFRLSKIVLCLILVGESLHASPPSRIKFDPDAWVRARVDALVRSARVAFQDSDKLASYERLLNSIARTLRQRRLSQDESFVSRYHEFVEYVQAASLDQLPGHELGFTVPDKQYFLETRQYVQVPEFLLSQSFLRYVSRYETLERAKSFLRELNSTREPSRQLMFFSYRSRHLGTPDNDDS